MAPTNMRALERRAQITVAGNTLIISLVVLLVCGIFCAVVFFMICKKQRRTQKAQRRMQEESRPFVAPQYPAQQGAPTQAGPYHYDGPLELQGSVDPEPASAQQLDGYAAAAKSDHNRPIELPTYAVTK